MTENSPPPPARMTTLTHELRTAKSLLRILLKQHLPNLVPVMRAGLKAAVGDHEAPLAPALAGTPASSLGHAINERLVLGRATRADLSRSPAFGVPLSMFTIEYQQFMSNTFLLNDLADIVNPTGPGDESDDGTSVLPRNEDRAARLTVLLGLIDQCSRSGLLGDTLMQVLGAADLDAALALVDPVWVNDVATVARLNLPVLEALPGPVVVGPTFSGSPLVRRAEGDLIIGTTLIDVKAVTDPSLANWKYMQVLMYALLDLDDEYELDQVAVLLARHGTLVRWGIDEILDLGGHLTRAQARERILGPLHEPAGAT